MKLFKRLKTMVKAITWPSLKNIVKDTVLVVLFSVISSSIIFGLSFCIEKLLFFIF